MRNPWFILRVFVYEQRVPKDGHGPVVIIDETRALADMQFLKEYYRKWPKMPPIEAARHLRNAEVTEKPCWRGIVLDHHGI